jgi:hypothetical protein
MSEIVGLFTQGRQKVQFIQTSTGTIITIDASLQETHERQSPPTEFEVEDGSTVSDHIIVKPFSLKVQGIITDTPLSLINAALSTVASAILPPVGIIGAGIGVALSKALVGSKSPSVAAYGQLLNLQSTKLPFDVLTSLQRYSSMWIKSISVPRDAQTGKAIVFDVELVQLLLVSPKSVNTLIFKNADLSAAEQDEGKQNLTNPALEAAKQGVKDGTSLAGGAAK